MREVFGIPVDTLLVVLAIALGVAFAVLAVLAIRNRILVRLACATPRVGAAGPH